MHRSGMVVSFVALDQLRAMSNLCGVGQVRYWMSSGVVLDAYSDVPAFRAVKEESEQVIGRLKKKLSDRLDSTDTCREDLHEAASLLMQLKDPREALLRKYLAVRERRLQSCIKSTMEGWASKSGGISAAVKAEDGVSLLSTKVLDEAKDFLLSFNDLLPLTSGSQEKDTASESHEAKGGDGGEQSGGIMDEAVDAVSRSLEAYWRGALALAVLAVSARCPLRCPRPAPLSYDHGVADLRSRVLYFSISVTPGLGHTWQACGRAAKVARRRRRRRAMLRSCVARWRRSTTWPSASMPSPRCPPCSYACKPSHAIPVKPVMYPGPCDTAAVFGHSARRSEV